MSATSLKAATDEGAIAAHGNGTDEATMRMWEGVRHLLRFRHSHLLRK